MAEEAAALKPREGGAPLAPENAPLKPDETPFNPPAEEVFRPKFCPNCGEKL